MSSPVNTKGLIFAILGLEAGLRPAASPAQAMFQVVTTVLDGDPFSRSDIRTDFSPGERLSIHVILDTQGLGVRADTIAVALRFPAGALKKLIRDGSTPPGTGWPVVDGQPMIADKQDLPESLQPKLGRAYFSITSSSSNPECPCDADNGPGMEAVAHFLMVDMMRQVSLSQGVHHLFRTDWTAPKECSVPSFTIEVTDGPGTGLRGLGQPLRNMVVGTIPGQVIEFGRGLTASGTSVRLECSPNPRNFLRGDPSSNGKVELTDAVLILEYLFDSGTFSCMLAADVDDSGRVNVTDAIYLLNALFKGGTQVPAPYPKCGLIPASARLSCEVACGE